MSIESERLDRMEQHLKLLKKSAEDQNKTLDVDFRLEKLENDYNITKDNMNQLKWFARGLGGVIFAIVLWSVTK